MEPYSDDLWLDDEEVCFSCSTIDDKYPGDKDEVRKLGYFICLYYRIQDVEDDDKDEAPGVKTPALVIGKKSAKPAEEESDDDAVRLRLVSGSTRIATLKNSMSP